MSKQELINKLCDIRDGLSMYIANGPTRFRVRRAQLDLDDLIDQLRKDTNNEDR